MYQSAADSETLGGEVSAAIRPNRLNSEFWIVVAAAVACAIKIVIALNTFGTNDVAGFYKFGQSLSQRGLEQTYASMIAFNHPPLVAHYLQLIYWLNQLPAVGGNGLPFPFLLRLPAIMADFGSVIVLLRLGTTMPSLKLPVWALALFALSPTSIMVSGFHGNTDSVMVMFLLLASLFCTREQPIFCGIFLALSCQIKILPLLFLPIFIFFWHHRRTSGRFLLALTSVSLILWSEPLLQFPALFFHNVLSYGSFWGLWGITYLLKLTGWPEFQRVSYFDLTGAQIVVGTFLKVLIVAAVVVIGWRRRALPSQAIFGSLALSWMTFFVFSPGVCAQYLVWFAPFTLILMPALYGCLEVASALALFFFYNTIADAFPWYIGISDDRHASIWTPGFLFPWLVFVAGLIVLWRHAAQRDGSLRLVTSAP